MRILLPYMDTKNRKIDDPIVSGGVERFCRLIKEDLGGERYPEYSVKVEQVPYRANKGMLYEGSMISYEERIMHSANNHHGVKSNIIIVNYPSATFTGARIQQSPIPIMFICHNLYPFPSIIERMNRLVDYGHSVYMVSKYQHEYYNAMAKRLGKTIEVAGYINPSYCREKVEVVTNWIDWKYQYVTIGRCEHIKDPFLLRGLVLMSGYQNLIITAQPHPDDKGEDYLKEQLKYYKKHKDEPDTLWDLPHSEVLENLRHCGAYFSTHHAETWGISAMEALSCGVPIILNAKNGKHASTEIASSPEHYKIIAHNDKEEILDAFKSLRKVDRKEIQEMTLEKHSKRKWVVAMMEAMDKTVENFKKKRTILDDFM